MARVLVIEDEPMLKKMYEKILIDEHFDVATAADGIEGYDKARQFQPDVILLDLLMPKMTGFEFIDKLKTDDLLKFSKIIVITNVFADERELMDKGASEVLLKTQYTPEQIVQKIRTVLAPPNPKPI